MLSVAWTLPSCPMHFFPSATLALPIQKRRQRLQAFEMDRVAPLQNRSQEQNLLLKVGSQLEQIHRLRILIPPSKT